MKALNGRRQMRESRQRSMMLILLILGMALLMTSVVAAQNGGGGVADAGPSLPQAPNATAVPGGPGLVMLTSFNFKPYTPGNTNYSFTGYGLKNNDTVEQSFIAPFQLPNGVTIKKMVVYYTDQDITKQLDVLLVAVPMSFGYGVVMASISSTSTTGIGFTETTTINTPLVDLTNNAYAIQLKMPVSSSVMFVGVRIDYAYETNLPLISK